MSEDVDTNPARDALWAAFLAGFACSEEGYNGEYGGPPAGEAPADESYLRDRFEKWHAARRRQ